ISKRNFIAFIISIVILTSFITSSCTCSGSLEQKSSVNSRNVIIMIGDGMGWEHVKLARLVEVGEKGPLDMERLPFWLNITTHNIDNGITWSCAAATAMATGNKTRNGFVAMSPSSEPLKTILEIAEDLGKSTGVVTTTEVSQATPACFMTHVSDRNNYSEITRQIVEDSDVDVLMGGGRSFFSADQIASMVSKGFTFVENSSSLNTMTSGNVLGLFAYGAMPYESARDGEFTPSLSDMTRKAIEILSQSSNGFFLVVEGGKIDHSSHAHDKLNAVLETIEFSKAVAHADSYARSNGNTLLIVVADHETGGPTIQHSVVNNTVPIMGMTAEQNESLRRERMDNITVSWSTPDHTDAKVPCFVNELNFTNLENGTAIDNTGIFKIMQDYLGTPATSKVPFAGAIDAILILIIFSYNIRKRKKL
ncbi:MAG: alkaline phosphatase, partial [Candidatus Odinarchaeota archaeon]